MRLLRGGRTLKGATTLCAIREIAGCWQWSSAIGLRLTRAHYMRQCGVGLVYAQAANVTGTAATTKTAIQVGCTEGGIC